MVIVISLTSQWTQGGKFAVGEWRVPEHDGVPIEIPNKQLRASDATAARSAAARPAAGRSSSGAPRLSASNARVAGTGVKVVPADKVGAGKSKGKAKGHGKGHGKSASAAAAGSADSPGAGNASAENPAYSYSSPSSLGESSGAGSIGAGPMGDNSDAITTTANVIVTSTRANGQVTRSTMTIAGAAMATPLAASSASGVSAAAVSTGAPALHLYDIQTTVMTTTGASAVSSASR